MPGTKGEIGDCDMSLRHYSTELDHKDGEIVMVHGLDVVTPVL